MARIWNAILDNTTFSGNLPEDIAVDVNKIRTQLNVDINAILDADIIMTAAILGFAAGQFLLDNKVRFAYETPFLISWEKKGIEEEKERKEKKDRTDTRDKLEKVVEKINKCTLNYKGKNVKETFSSVLTESLPNWEEGGMITGMYHGEKKILKNQKATKRDIRNTNNQDINADNADVYKGRGAYTGIFDNPISQKVSPLLPTFRSNIIDNERWSPRAETWGLIAGLREIEGMRAEENEKSIVGYTHGMIQAIYHCVRKGPWCTPYEIATGTETTKLASCFPCTLFMYAAGYPPSAIHLGRGESWVPLDPHNHAAINIFNSIGENKEDLGYMKDSRGVYAFTEIIRSVNILWYNQCWQHLRLGVNIMENLGQKMAVRDVHIPRLNVLKEYLAYNKGNLTTAGNLILDAVTVHCGEVDRIDRTLVSSK